MVERIGWGILGAGSIARSFLRDLAKLDDAVAIGVASRSIDKASQYADEYGIQRAYGSYEEMLGDPEVQAVYVATPHTFHAEHTLLCLEHGKAVLCEKPLSVNAQTACTMVDAARAKGLFLMEAMWTRFLPVMVQVRRWLDEGVIGEVRQVTADFGFRSSWNPEGRLLNPLLAGGALLDVGVYVVALASLVYGQQPESVQAWASIGETGVDEQTGMQFGYPGGAMAQLSCAVRTSTAQRARIDGTEGSIDIPAFWHATEATLRVSGKDAIVFGGEAGYHFEAAEVMRCLRKGLAESPTMTWDKSLAIAATMDRVRAEIGLVYPFE